MQCSDTNRSGQHFLQIPGPANMPDRVLRAMARPLIDHRGPAFARMTRRILEGLQSVFKTTSPVIVYPASGHGAWEAALVNTLSPGDRILACENGHFAFKWCEVAERLGFTVERIAGDWRRGVDPAAVEARLAEDPQHDFKAVLVVHNETSTGVTSHVSKIRNALNRTGHPALFLVDAVSSLGTSEYCHDDWGADVTVSASQKGLMMSPGLSFNAVSEKALAAARSATSPKAFWDWKPILSFNERGFFPYTPATTLFFGLDEALGMLLSEGLERVFDRHARMAEATRRAADAWGLEIQCLDREEASNTTTALRMPEGCDADLLRQTILDNFDMSLGKGLGKLERKVFRIGHLGNFNDLMLTATLGGVEMGLSLAGVPHERGGVQAAADYLVSSGSADS